MKPKVLISWSSGKDSAWALKTIIEEGRYNISGLLTTVTENFDRISMHGVRNEILEAQAKNLGLPLFTVSLPWPCTNEIYEERMRAAIEKITREGISAIAFGDLFLEDLKQYRIEKMKGTGIEAIFPIWSSPEKTHALALEMMDAGVKTKIACLDPKKLDISFLGRDWNRELLKDLPEGVDPCAENGEFHTLCYDSPIFKKSLDIEAGEVVEREGIHFIDFKLRQRKASSVSLKSCHLHKF